MAGRNKEVVERNQAPVNHPVDKEVETVDLPDIGVIRQENVGPGEREGGGEWPDPHTPPRGPSPGAGRTDSGQDR